MGKIIFGGKMFYLGTLRMTRAWLVKFGITPARFNMLCAIATGSGSVSPSSTGTDPRGVAQHDLLRLLGVTSPTICRMLASLEALGLIFRTPHPRNPRHRWVALTMAGTHRLREALDEIIGDPEYGWSICEMLNPIPGNRAAAAIAIRDADAMFTRARVMLGDTATLAFDYD